MKGSYKNNYSNILINSLILGNNIESLLKSTQLLILKDFSIKINTNECIIYQRYVTLECLFIHFLQQNRNVYKLKSNFHTVLGNTTKAAKIKIKIIRKFSFPFSGCYIFYHNCWVVIKIVESKQQRLASFFFILYFHDS